MASFAEVRRRFSIMGVEPSIDSQGNEDTDSSEGDSEEGSSGEDDSSEESSSEDDSSDDSSSEEEAPARHVSVLPQRRIARFPQATLERLCARYSEANRKTTAIESVPANNKNDAAKLAGDNKNDVNGGNVSVDITLGIKDLIETRSAALLTANSSPSLVVPLNKNLAETNPQLLVLESIKEEDEDSLISAPGSSMDDDVAPDFKSSTNNTLAAAPAAAVLDNDTGISSVNMNFDWDSALETRSIDTPGISYIAPQPPASSKELIQYEDIQSTEEGV
ncbi:hypothetical protein HDU67_004950, partial [Dinochytrium kinnereticum]